MVSDQGRRVRGSSVCLPDPCPVRGISSSAAFRTGDTALRAGFRTPLTRPRRRAIQQTRLSGAAAGLSGSFCASGGGAESSARRGAATLTAAARLPQQVARRQLRWRSLATSWVGCSRTLHLNFDGLDHATYNCKGLSFLIEMWFCIIAAAAAALLIC